MAKKGHRLITVKYMELFEDFGEGFEEFPHDS